MILFKLKLMLVMMYTRLMAVAQGYNKFKFKKLIIVNTSSHVGAIYSQFQNLTILMELEGTFQVLVLVVMK